MNVNIVSAYTSSQVAASYMRYRLTKQLALGFLGELADVTGNSAPSCDLCSGSILLLPPLKMPQVSSGSAFQPVAQNDLCATETEPALQRQET